MQVRTSNTACFQVMPYNILLVTRSFVLWRLRSYEFPCKHGHPVAKSMCNYSSTSKQLHYAPNTLRSLRRWNAFAHGKLVQGTFR